MSKRLEEIKNVSEFQIDNDSYYGRPANVILNGDDVKWLIEQAERVQELERELEEHKSKFTVKYTMSLREQNKRYRETLWDINIKLRDLFVEVWDMDNGELQGKFYKMSKIIQNELEESE